VETAVRIAVGATRWRLVRQIATECGALVLVGGMLGIALAYAAIPFVIRAIAAAAKLRSDRCYPLKVDLSVDFRVLAFTLATCAATALLFRTRASTQRRTCRRERSAQDGPE